jgi:hypothetical protein
MTQKMASVELNTNLVSMLEYAAKCLPVYFWQRITRRAPVGKVHLIITLADHFEPASTASRRGYAPRSVQLQRLENWCTEYPKNFDQFRDREGHVFKHTYFFPAEQYDEALVERLSEFCHTGWGEVEIHLHHGIDEPATSENTRQQLLSFRDTLAQKHGCLSYAKGDSTPKYAFVHGNFALANCAQGYACGVNDEMRVLADTGCYVDMTFPTSAFHPGQIAIVNSLYECRLPLGKQAPHRRGEKLRVGRPISVFPFLVQGPWMPDFDRSSRTRLGRIENGAISNANPPSLRRLALWKKAAIAVIGRPDWIFIKIHTHAMAPSDTDVVLRSPMQRFLSQLTEGAPERGEILHFTSAREMANIVLAACEGREGNPDNYRDYRYRLVPEFSPVQARSVSGEQMSQET